MTTEQREDALESYLRLAWPDLLTTEERAWLELRELARRAEET